jgi:hypothetical protein
MYKYLFINNFLNPNEAATDLGLSAKVAKPQPGYSNTGSLPNHRIVCSRWWMISSTASTSPCFLDRARLHRSPIDAAVPHEF